MNRLALARGDKVKLVGKTLRGKNRIGQHGSIWTVDTIGAADFLVKSERDTFQVAPGEWSRDLRWISLFDDPDFTVEKLS